MASMSKEEMKKFLLEELAEEKYEMVNGRENHYSFLFMLCNDMGLIDWDIN